MDTIYSVPRHPVQSIYLAVCAIINSIVEALLFLSVYASKHIFEDVLSLWSTKSNSMLGSDFCEPPTISSTVPLLGHLYGIFMHGSQYTKHLEYDYLHITRATLIPRSQKHKLSLYTMRIPGYKVYVATTPEAVRAIYRNPKTMEFAKIQRIAMRRLFNYPEEAIDKLGMHLNGDGTLKLINKPGPELDEVNSKGEAELAKLIRSFVANGSQIQLCSTLRELLTFAICAALWGSEYPMLHDPTLEEDFWTWVEHFWGLLILPAQSMTAKRGYDARERLWSSILSYTHAGGHQQASAVVSAEYHLYKSLGLNDDAVARAGTVSLFVVVSNTVMAGLWLTMMIYSQPDLLDKIRDEVKQCTTIDENDQKRHIVNTTKLKTGCPLLLSTFRETLRHYMDFSLNRFVADDTTIRIPSSDETFLLKKGSIVQLAGPLMQQQPLIWGHDSEKFNECRFMAGQGCPMDAKVRTYGVNNRTSIPDPARPIHVSKDQKTAFTSFGGGNHTCPGRFFAAHIISAMAAVLVSGYDIKGEDGGPIVPPSVEKSLGHGVKLPEHDIPAHITKRVGYEDAVWVFEG